MRLTRGNYVDTVNRDSYIHLPNGCPMKIGEIGFFDVSLYEIDKPFAQQIVSDKIGIHDLSLIPLTEQWLLDFGFKTNPSKNALTSFTKELLNIVMKGNGSYKNGRTYFNGWCILEHQSEYVHQLQNLYFALTGKELTKE